MHAYALVVVDDLEVRSIALAAALTVIALLTARDLWRLRGGATRASATFLSVVLLLHGLFLTVRGAMVVAGARAGDVLAGGAFDAAPWVDAFVLSNLLRFDLVNMVNQRVHAEIREGRNRLELLFETSPDAVLITRPEDGLCRSVNAGFEELTGWSREEVLGTTAVRLRL